jgi:uncharacterized protein YjbI with pentapeptide repeats
MLTTRNREPPTVSTQPTSFAARAKDLGALRDAVVDAASVGTGLWLSYLFVLFYFAIAAGAVTHRDLLLENPVKLPFLNVELPLKAFFVLGPLVFLIVHAYVLLHFVLLAGKVGAFGTELEAQIGRDDVKARLRRQLPSNIFVQFIAGPREVRSGVIGFLLRLIPQISLVAGPIALLVLFQLQFLPYQNEWITSWQRVAVVIDLILLWILWPPIARGETARLDWNDFKRLKVLAWLAVSILPVLLVCTIATFPRERLENLPSLPLVPTAWPKWSPEGVQAEKLPPQDQPSKMSPRDQSPKMTQGDQSQLAELRLKIAAVLESMKFTSLHELLVAGKVNYVTGRPKSLWSNVLVLPNFEIGDRVKFDAEGKTVISSDAVSLRGRSLEGAVLVLAHLRKADFIGAQLANANFSQADLREAKFDCGLNPAVVEFEKDIICTRLQGAWFVGAQLQGASFAGAQLQGALLWDSQLQGALLRDAQLQGASLMAAQLRGASLRGAQLQGASLQYAQLQGASLDDAQLQGASLGGAQLQGASLWATQLQGASLGGAQLQGASLINVFVWRTDAPLNEYMSGALVEAPETAPENSPYDCGQASCDWSEKPYEALKSLIEGQVPVGDLRDSALKQITKLEKPPFVQDKGSAKAWADLAKSSPPADLYYKGLVRQLKDIGCSADGGPYVIGGLTGRISPGQMLDYPFADYPSQEAAIAVAFLDEAHCPGARGLSEENKAELRKIRDQIPPPPSFLPGTR